MMVRDYGGIRLTGDGMDCALPVSIDSHSICTYDCLYCFAQSLVEHKAQRTREVGQTPLRDVEKLFSGKGPKEYGIYREALKYEHPDRDYPCPVQLGALADPMDNLERKHKWLLDLIPLAIKYRQPVRMSTKGTAGMLPEYLAAFSKAPELFWVSFSINTPDDQLIRQIDRHAPNATERLAAMKAMAGIGVNVSLRLRPAFPGISDSTKNHPRAYADLIGLAKDAGACAISYECGFLDGHPGPYLIERYQRMEAATGIPYRRIYASFGASQACTRPAAQFTEEFMHAVKVEAVKANLWIGISDPVWKQLGECGCCCGIPKEHKVFGNWQTESATNQMLRARDTGAEIGPDDIVPKWADKVLLSKMCNLRAGPKQLYKKRHKTWADKLRNEWNDTQSERGPAIYFQGAMKPVRAEPNGDIFYRYQGLKQSGILHTPFWKVL